MEVSAFSECFLFFQLFGCNLFDPALPSALSLKKDHFLINLINTVTVGFYPYCYPFAYAFTWVGELEPRCVKENAGFGVSTSQVGRVRRIKWDGVSQRQNGANQPHDDHRN